MTVERFLIQHPRRSGTAEVVLATEHDAALKAARTDERERLRGYFRDALADKGIVWPGEVDILYDKCFAAPYVPDEDA
jgi:hypothetical protein